MFNDNSVKGFLDRMNASEETVLSKENADAFLNRFIPRKVGVTLSYKEDRDYTAKEVAEKVSKLHFEVFNTIINNLRKNDADIKVSKEELLNSEKTFFERYAPNPEYDLEGLYWGVHGKIIQLVRDKGRPVYYNEVMDKLMYTYDLNNVYPLMFKLLEGASRVSEDAGKGLVSVLVVNADTMQPGKGFYTFAKGYRDFNSTSMDSITEMTLKEMNFVAETWNLNLSEGA